MSLAGRGVQGGDPGGSVMRRQTSLHDVVVVGGGIVGLATAFRLLETTPARRLVLLEKEPKVGVHQSAHNSGVLHAGVYYEPGSLKSMLCSSGKRLMERFAEEHGIPVVRNGKVIVAVDPSELGRFQLLAQRAEANGVPGVRVIGPAELREIEPHVVGWKAIYSPETAVVDFGRVSDALAAEIQCRGGEVRTSAEVVGLRDVGDRVLIESVAGAVEGKVTVVCGGLQADRLAAAAGRRVNVAILPFRGSWYSLRHEAKELVRGNIYPVPDPRLPFLGVHFTRRFDESVWLGPNAVPAGGRETYVRGTLNLRDLAAAAAFPGAWRLARRYWVTGAREIFRDRFPRAYVREAQRYLPELRLEDLVPGPTGIRAQAVRADGTMVDDFLVDGTARMLHVLNAPSPAATSALAIGRILAAEVAERLQQPSRGVD